MTEREALVILMGRSERVVATACKPFVPNGTGEWRCDIKLRAQHPAVFKKAKR